MQNNIDVLIIEDESKLAELHAEFIREIPKFNVIGIASTLQDAYKLLDSFRPKLILLDNYLPDGQGIELLEFILNNNYDSYAIFITASIDINICSKAIKYGAFGYLIKPISYNRLKSCLERFKVFINRQSNTQVINQRKVDELFKLQTDLTVETSSTNAKGIEDITLEKVQLLFTDKEIALTVDDVVEKVNLSKTTARRYLEYCLQIEFLEVQLEYGKVGRPERKYRLVDR